MDNKWKVKVYESLAGDKPVETFLNSLIVLESYMSLPLEKHSYFYMDLRKNPKKYLRRKLLLLKNV